MNKFGMYRRYSLPEINIKSIFYKYFVVFIIIFNIIPIKAGIDEIKSSSYSQTEKEKLIIEFIFKSFDTKDFDAQIFLKETNEILSLSKNDSLTTLALILKGKLHHYLGEYPKAVLNYTEALKKYETKQDIRAIADCYHHLGETYRAIGSYESAIKYLNNSKNIFLEFNDTLKLVRVYNRLAAVYLEMRDSVNTFLNIEYSMNLIPYIKSGYVHLASNYNIMGGFYVNSNQKKAFECFQKSLAIADSFELEPMKPNILNNMAIILYRWNDFNKSLEYSLQALDCAERMKINSYIPLASRIVSSSYYAMGKYKEAFDYLKYSAQSKDNLVSEKTNQQIIEIRTKFETEKKEDELKYQKSLLLYQGLIFGSIILMILLVTIVFFNRNRMLKIKNSELVDKNTVISDQNSRLSIVNSTKDKFFSIIAHDLKNPLGNFREVTKFLHESYNDLSEEEKIDFIEMMKDSSDNIYSLLENLLDWSRSQRGIIPYQPVSVNLFNIAENTLQLLKPSADNKKIKIENNIEYQIEVLADPNMLTTVIRNLVSNAVKFTPEAGKIEVGTSIVNNLNNSDSTIKVFVKDNGVGIDKDTIEKLFQIDKSITTTGTMGEGGTGIGLILCKEFINKHGGHIGVESELGKGSTFYFTLPKNN